MNLSSSRNALRLFVVIMTGYSVCLLMLISITKTVNHKPTVKNVVLNFNKYVRNGILNFTVGQETPWLLKLDDKSVPDSARQPRDDQSKQTPSRATEDSSHRLSEVGDSKAFLENNLNQSSAKSVAHNISSNIHTFNASMLVVDNHNNVVKDTENITPVGEKIKPLEDIARVMAKAVRVVPPDVHLAQNESFFALRRSVVTPVTPLWLVQPSPCPSRQAGEARLLLVVILSVNKDSSVRQAIRKTWASVAYKEGALSDAQCEQNSSCKHEPHHVTRQAAATDERTLSVTDHEHLRRGNNATALIKVVFFLGRRDEHQADLAKNEPVEKSIRLESDQFRDIAMADFTDTYGNLSLKMATVIQWVNDYCPSADHVIKVDQDTVVNIPLLVKVLEHLSTSPTGSGPFVLGHQHLYDRPPATREGRWAVNVKDYPLEYFPRYVYGHSYVISRDAIPILRHACQHMPLVANEDAYVTGVLAKAGNVTRLTTAHMASVVTWQNCLMATNEIITQTGHRDTESLYRKWAIMQDTLYIKFCLLNH